MSLSTPIWNKNLSALFIRVPIGLYFALAGRLKLQDLEGFIDTVRAFNILPNEVATVYGVMIPWVEISIGIALIFGVLTTLSAITGSLLLLSYILALGIFPNHPEVFNKDLVLLGGMLSLLASGSGSFGFDALRKSSSA